AGCGPEPVAAGEDVAAAVLPLGGVGGDGGQGLVEGPGAEPEVGRGSARSAEPAQGVEQGPFEVLAEGRFPRDAAGLLEPDGGGDDRLVGPAFRGEGDAGGGADQDGLATGVHPEGPRLEGPGDEGVV